MKDIENTCESLVEKVGHMQVNLLTHPDKELGQVLDKMNNDFSNSLANISKDYEACQDKVAAPR